MKIRKELCDIDKNSYASDSIHLPEGGIDCSEGCNPYGYPNTALSAIEAFDAHKFAAYPHSQRAYETIRDYWKEQTDIKNENILLTDGSIAGIYIINNVFLDEHAAVLGVAPQFSDYGANARLMGFDYHTVLLKEETKYEILVDDVLECITSDYCLVYIDNPNNPTGQTISLEDIERIVKKADEVDACVVIDEAYGDFITREESAINLLSRHDNLIVQRTMSKGFGLAGIRAGYILASKRLISYMKKISNPYMVGEFSREMISAVLAGENHIPEHTKKFEEAKKKVEQRTGKNLMMAKTDYRVPICLIKYMDGDVDIVKKLFDQGVLAVPGAEFDGLDQSFARVRMPIEKDLPKLLLAIETING